MKAIVGGLLFLISMIANAESILFKCDTRSGGQTSGVSYLKITPDFEHQGVCAIEYLGTTGERIQDETANCIDESTGFLLVSKADFSADLSLLGDKGYNFYGEIHGQIGGRSLDSSVVCWLQNNK